MQKVAVAFNQFADSGAKSAAMTALTGKSAKEAAPYLRDLATETGITAKVTAEQAAAAEELQKSYRRITTASAEAKEAMARELIPTLQKAIDEFNEGIRVAGGFWNALKLFGTINPLNTVGENIKSVRGEIDKLNDTRARLISQGRTGWLPQVDRELAAAKKQKEFLEFQQRAEALALNKGKGRGESKDDRVADGLKQLKFDPLDKTKKKADDAAKALHELNAAWVKNIDQIIEVEHATGMAANEGKSMQQTLEEQEKAAARTAEAWVKMIDQIEEYERATGLAANGGKSMLQVQQDTRKELSETDKLLEALADKVDGYSQKIAEAFVDFATGAQDAKFSFTDFVTSVLRQMAQMATQMLLIEPLMASFKKWLKDLNTATPGGDSFLAKLFGGGTGTPAAATASSGGGIEWAKGGAIKSASLSRYSGGVYDSPHFFEVAKGGGIREAGAEVILPLKRGADGKLGVDTSGGGGDVQVNVYNEARAEVQTKTRSDVNGNRIIEVLVKEAVGNAIKSGAFDGVMGATFGLNRMGAR